MLHGLLVACLTWLAYFLCITSLVPFIFLNPEGCESWPWYMLPELWRFLFVLILCALAFEGTFAIIKLGHILAFGKGMDLADIDTSSFSERAFANATVAVAILVAVGAPHASVGRGSLLDDWIFVLLWLLVLLMPYGAYVTRARPRGIDGSLLDRLADGTIRLVSIRWLLAQPAGGPIWRCQDMPAEAFVDASRTGALLAGGKVAAISYGHDVWLSTPRVVTLCCEASFYAPHHSVVPRADQGRPP